MDTSYGKKIYHPSGNKTKYEAREKREKHEKHGKHGKHDKRENDWKCSCGANCFASRNDCFKCGNVKPSSGSEQLERKKKPEQKVRTNVKEKYVADVLNMKNIFSDRPPQQSNELLYFLTEKFNRQQTLIDLNNKDEICDWYGFTTMEKLIIDALVSCNIDDIKSVSDYINRTYNLFDESIIEDILNTVVAIKESFKPNKVANEVIRGFYLSNLSDVVKIKQTKGKYSASIIMKTVCIHITVRQMCENLKIYRGLAK